MSSMIPDEVIAEIREQTDIVQVIGQHVQLKRSGINHKGLCPFHDEKTPSFNVNSQRQFFHCFGCHESGDVFTFLMKIEGRRFYEVVEDLAARAGVTIPRQNRSPSEVKRIAQQRSERQQGLDLNEKATRYYQEMLASTEGLQARRYLEQRGIEPQMAQRFRLGYATAAGSGIVRLLEQEEAKGEEVASRLGLVARRAHGGLRDYFWQRLMFPVCGASNEVLGFSGRLLGGDDGPKYINTPDTFLFHKGEVLYGLSVAAAAMRKTGAALLVEGNLDVIQMHQHGFENTVAPMGTALTTRQVRLLHRFCPQVIALFDGDDAGKAAAQKAVVLLVEGGIEAKIASLPKGDDPDSLLRQHGASAITELMATAQPAIDFLLQCLQEKMDPTIIGQAKVLETISPIIAKLPSPVARELYASQVALSLGIEQRTVQRTIAGHRPSAILGQPKEGEKKKSAPQVLPRAELDILGILVEHPHLFPKAGAADVSSLLTNASLRATYQAAMQIQKSSGHIDPPSLLQKTPVEIRDAVAEVILSGTYAIDGDPTRALNDCLSALRRSQLQKELQEIRSQIAQTADEGKKRALAIRLVEVEREIHETR